MSAEQKRLLTLPEIKMGGDDDGPGYIEGYGAVKHNVDSYGDIIVDGAFKNLDEFIQSGFMSDSHDWTKDIGYIESAVEDEHGLRVRMVFYDTPESQGHRKRVAARLAAGKSVGLSIGYFTTDWDWTERDGEDIRLLKGIKVIEIGIVTMPANELALATGSKDKGDKNDFYSKGNGVPLDAQFDFLTAEAADLSQRLDDIAKDRPAEWREEKAQRLITIADTLTQAATAVKSLNGADEPEELPENWEQILADAQKHLSN